ncbi:ArnT family glycosyltransferase [Pseudomonadota bacterium]
MIARSKISGIVISTLIVFLLAVSYYSYTSKNLPIGAGPDSSANYDAVRFYYEHQRLALFPEDEDKVTYSPYGTTRLVRPPLAFIVSALLMHASPFKGKTSAIAFRAGSVLLCALTVALTFLGLRCYFDSNWYASLGSALIGLLPQFTFLASHVNDDSGAIFSATLLICSFIYIHRRGIDLLSISLLGASIGLVLLSKLSAWLLFPSTLIFVLSFVRFKKEYIVKYAALTAVCIILAGGWWVLYNTYHYGIDDPAALKINQEIAQIHRTLPPNKGHGFASKGVGFYELIINNHKDFIGASFAATIGNLDWLRLKVGPLQYGLYLLVVVIAAIYFLMRLITFCTRLVTGTLDKFDKRTFSFESILVFTILFQMFMFVWRNVYQDIQIQGKYMLPVFLAVLVLFLSALRCSVQAINHQLEKNSLEAFWISGRNLMKMTAVAGIFFIIYVHLHGLFTYVIPFYYPPAYSLDTGRLSYMDLSKPQWIMTSKDITIQTIDDKWEITSHGVDPHLVLPAKLCEKLGSNFLLQIRFNAVKKGQFQAFVDDGGGFRRNKSDRITYDAGNNTILLGLSANQCKAVRLDPMSTKGEMTISEIAVSKLAIKTPR